MIKKELYAAPQTEVLELAVKQAILNVSDPKTDEPTSTGEDFDSWDN